jgi:hypothetical protein
MHAQDADLMAAVRRAMGRSTAPSTITQEAFDGDAGHVQRLVGLTYVANIYTYDIAYRLVVEEAERRAAAKAAVKAGTSNSSPPVILRNTGAPSRLGGALPPAVSLPIRARVGAWSVPACAIS